MDTNRERLKILHVVDSLEPGGMENGVANVANGLAGKGFEFHVCCLRNRGEFADRMPAPDLVRSLGKEPGFSLKWAKRLRSVAREVRPDILHTHNLGPLIYASLATWFGKSFPIIHGEHAELSPAELVPRRLRLRRWLYRACRSVHTVSESLTEHIRSVGLPDERLTTVVNGVDTDRFRPSDLAREDLSAFPFGSGGHPVTVLGAVSRFGEHKRHLELLEAFDRLAPGNPGLRLLLVGDGGPMKERVLDRVATSQHAERIHWAGFQRDPLPFYQMMDLLVVPSANEGLSNACLEAMSCGVPVLANESCGGSEILGGGRSRASRGDGESTRNLRGAGQNVET